MKFDDPDEERRHYAELKRRAIEARKKETVPAMKKRMNLK